MSAPPELDDCDWNDLFPKIVQGDQSAIELLYQIYYRRLRDSVPKRIASMPKLAGKERGVTGVPPVNMRGLE